MLKSVTIDLRCSKNGKLMLFYYWQKTYFVTNVVVLRSDLNFSFLQIYIFWTLLQLFCLVEKNKWAREMTFLIATSRPWNHIYRPTHFGTTSFVTNKTVNFKNFFIFLFCVWIIYCGLIVIHLHYISESTFGYRILTISFVILRFVI